MSSYSLAGVGATLRRHTVALVLAWAATFTLAVAALLAFAERPQLDVDAQLIANNSFERGIAPWEETGEATVERSIEDDRSGEAAAEVRALARDAFGLRYEGALVNPRRGERYVFTAWVRGVGTAVGNEVTILAFERGGPDERRAFVIGTGRIGASWSQVIGSGTITGRGRSLVSLHIVFNEARRIGETVFVDDVSLVRLAKADGR